MGMPKTISIYTVDEYLAIERFTEERHEFLDGEIYAMAGESLEHGVISSNILAALVSQLKGRPCQALSKDMKVRSGPSPKLPRSTRGLYSYPDIVVVCDEPIFHDDHKDVLLNPTVIVEVLSPTTEGFDRGDKMSRYQTWNPTLTDYLLVSQDEPRIEHLSRPRGAAWTPSVVIGLEASVILASIACTLKMADVYDRISFPQTDDEGA